jgi:hypothetical protein
MLLSILAGTCVVGFGLLAQQAATEAPAGFETPTLAKDPGTQSVIRTR